MFEQLRRHQSAMNDEKYLLLNEWVNKEIVRFVLDDNNFDRTYFLEQFAGSIVEHIYNVIADEKRLGSCPTIDSMLVIFKKKNIHLTDILIA